MDHWRRGHKQICKEIHRGGNAEKYHADKKYKEAVAAAVAKCAADTKGQTCYICNNLAATLKDLNHFQEAKALLRKALPVARRVLGDHQIPLMMGKIYGEVLCRADGATLDDFREAVETLEDTARTARRVLGGAHPTVEGIESCLRNARSVFGQCLGRELD